MPCFAEESIEYLVRWFSNGAPQEVARCAAIIMKVYSENEEKPMCIGIYYIHDFYSYLSAKVSTTSPRSGGRSVGIVR
jgi:hypothetical protein